MPRFRRFKRRFSSRGGQRARPRWAAQVGAGNLVGGGVAGSVLEIPIVGGSAAQWFDGIEGELRVERMVGNIELASAATAAAATGVGFGIVRFSEFDVVQSGGEYDPLQPVALGEKDWLHFWNTNIWGSAGALEPQVRRHDFDIRVKRRLENADRVSAVFSHGGGAADPDIIVTIDIRILIVFRL